MDYSGQAIAEGVKVVAGVSNGTYVNSTQVTQTRAYTENWNIISIGDVKMGFKTINNIYQVVWIHKITNVP